MRILRDNVLLFALICVIVGFIAGLAVYARIDLFSFFGPGGDGTYNLLFTFVGLLGDIVVIGLIFTASLKAYEARKWQRLAGILDTHLRDSAWKLLLYSTQYRSNALSDVNALRELPPGELDAMSWPELYGALAHQLLMGQRLNGMAAAIAEAIRSFPTANSPGATDYVEIALAASKVTSEITLDSQYYLSLAQADYEGRYRDLLDWADTAHIGHDTTVADFLLVLEEKGVFAVASKREEPPIEVTFFEENAPLWTGSLVSQALHERGPEQKRRWEDLLSAMLGEGYTDLATVQGCLDGYRPGAALTLFAGTPREVLLQAPPDEEEGA